ncbi:MAG: hypothetical protein CUN55_19820 [Phototrophicales bacterium]|nr:MAG: hypothetical protein CUN55_19820 [Phototrophicales bacterium]
MILGMGPVPWVLNAEIYPNWARSTGAALSTATNWTANFVISETFLLLTEEVHKYGSLMVSPENHMHIAQVLSSSML